MQDYNTFISEQQKRFLEQNGITKDKNKIYKNKFGDKFTFNRSSTKQTFLSQAKIFNFFAENNILKDKTIVIKIEQDDYCRSMFCLCLIIGINNAIYLNLRNLPTNHLSKIDNYSLFINNLFRGDPYSLNDPDFNTHFIKLINRYENLNFFNENKHLYNNNIFNHIVCKNNRFYLEAKPVSALQVQEPVIINAIKKLDIKDSKKIYKEIAELIAKKEIEQNKKQFNETLKKIPEHVSEKLTLKNKDKYKSVLNELVDKSNKKQEIIINDLTFINIFNKYNDVLKLVDFGLDKEEITRIFVEEYGNLDLELFLTVAYDYKDFRVL